MNVALSDKPAILSHSKLRVIPFEYFSGIQNMSLDYYYSLIVEKTQIPILRFYGWKPFCLSLGHHQQSNNLDLKTIVKNGIDIVRRPTGGSAIYHADELTYSFILPKTDISHQDMYYLFHYALCEALKSLGLAVVLSSIERPGSYLNQGKDTFACFNRAARSEIQFDGKKIVGSAQKIYKNTILQHGSIILGREHEKVLSFLNLTDEERSEQIDFLKNNAVAIAEISIKEIKRVLLAEEIVKKLADFHHIDNIFYKYSETEELNEARKYYDQFKIE